MLRECKTMTPSTIQGLDDHLNGINLTLQNPHTSPRSVFPPADAHRLENEQERTRMCLETCAQRLADINKLRLRSLSNGKQANEDAEVLSAEAISWADTVTLLALGECSERLNNVLLYLRANDGQGTRRLFAGEAPDVRKSAPGADGQFRRRVCESHSTMRGVHVVEDVKVGMGGQQMLISSLDRLFEARRITLDDGAVQVIMSTSDASVQEFFRTRV
ncbi:uncharacterized protein VDAG_02366 [Verticillium dahliae VdLs.17]|uniref:Fungal N-terminal domain-containing protein n=1 Tax=Verticillium dahliae (strain VdLs.17 / ATCC MYA-4575 / FGSC 10137) TaxID=498257 RepID=G2WXN4_VERDV|nr:uncharacterized protein VDAG_02366 [Verticillium dahliae VdLs.17]EGY20842.1 hypothetical protein VDAG_02366 [Verticillium dahliae VdLs.17]